MNAPPRVVFRDLPLSDEVQAECADLAQRLERIHPHIRSCDVVLAAAAGSTVGSAGFEVRILLIVPHGEIAVRRAPSAERDDLRRAVGEAFGVAGERLARFVEHDAVPERPILPSDEAGGSALAWRLGARGSLGFGAA